MARRLVTLDIDGTAIRLLEVRGRRVERWATAPLEPGVIENGVIRDPGALGARIKQLMRSSGIKATKVVASISGLYSVSRILSLATPGGELPRETILQTVRGVMPVPADELYILWQTVALLEDAQQVFVLAVPRNGVDAQIRALRSAGLTPDALDIKAVALARVVNQAQALILNIEPSSLDIVVVMGGRLQVMRTMALKDDLTAEERAGRVAEALGSAVNFYNSRHADSPIRPSTALFLTGQLATEPTLVERLKARVAHPNMPLTASLECPIQLPLTQYAVNIGLALRKSAGSAEAKGFSPFDINVLTATRPLRRMTARQAGMLLAILAAIVLLVPIYQLTTGALDKTTDLRVRIHLLDKKLELRQIEINKSAGMIATVQEYQAITGKKRGSFIGDLEAIDSQAAKLGIQVASVFHSGREVSISCSADNDIAFGRYYTALEETGRFVVPIKRPDPVFPGLKGGTILVVPKP